MPGIVATLKIKEGQQSQFEEVANQLVAASRAEPGCSDYTLWRTDDSSVDVFVERYQSHKAIEAHRKSEHFRQLAATRCVSGRSARVEEASQCDELTRHKVDIPNFLS